MSEMKINLELKLQSNKDLLKSLINKRDNIERNIINLEHKIINQETTLQTLK